MNDSITHTSHRPPRQAPTETGNPGASAGGAGDDTAEALVASARRLFSERGYDGASIRAITGDAGANLGAVTYHFGSKEALYHEVLRRAVAPLRDRVDKALALPGSTLDRATGVVDAYFEHFTQHPDLPRFLLQEVAAGRRPPPPIEEALQAISRKVSDVIRDGQEQGDIRAGDPLLFVLSLVSQPIYLVLVQRPLAEILGMDLTSEPLRKRAREHLLAFARAGLSGTHP
jgi:AcrR family transcriptional regulator